jgi:integrase
MRNYGSGSIRERKPSVWQLRVTAGRDPVTGKVRTVSETFHGGKKAAQQRLAQLVAQHSGGTSATTATLGSLLERWLDTARIAQSTKGNYRNALKHLPASMYAAPLNQVGAHELDAVYSALARGGLGAPTVRILHAALSSAFTQAVKWRWIPANPARNASPPPPNRRRTKAPTTDYLSRLLQIAAHDPLTHLWLRLVVVTGARRAEVLALRWQDIDGDQLTIAGALDIHRQRKATKTGDERRMTIDPATIRLLSEWQLKASERALSVGVRLGPNAYVISNEPDSSKPWRPDYASAKFRRLCSAAGLDGGTRLHDVRHGLASRMLAAGVDVATVSRRLGHSRTSTTVDVYAHEMPGTDAAAAEVAASGIDTPLRDTVG